MCDPMFLVSFGAIWKLCAASLHIVMSLATEGAQELSLERN